MGQRTSMHMNRQGSSAWLRAIEELRPGDACEVKCAATGQWLRGIVKTNGGASWWTIDVMGDTWHRYIEHVRCVGQAEAWPLQQPQVS